MRTMVEEQCACGCGKTIYYKKLSPCALCKQGEKRYVPGHQNIGKKHSQETKAKMARSLDKNGRWKGGRRIDKNGYVLIKNRQHPFANNLGYVREHRIVMEQHLERLLDPGEIVHHLNHNPADNRIENLMLLPNAASHMKECRTGHKFPRKDGVWFSCERCGKRFYRGKYYSSKPVRWCSWSCRYPGSH